MTLSHPMARNPLSPQQKLGAVAGLVLGPLVVVLGTWGPYENVWINGMVPVNVVGGVLTVLSVILLVVGPRTPAISPSASAPASTRR